MKQAIGLGAGGHAKVIIEILRLRGEFEIVGLLDANANLHGAAVLSVPVLGNDSMMAELSDRGVRHAFVGLGSTSDNRPRAGLYGMAKDKGFEVISAADQPAPRAAGQESRRHAHEQRRRGDPASA